MNQYVERRVHLSQGLQIRATVSPTQKVVNTFVKHDLLVARSTDGHSSNPSCITYIIVGAIEFCALHIYATQFIPMALYSWRVANRTKIAWIIVIIITAPEGTEHGDTLC
jgi:hypothetical protein